MICANAIDSAALSRFFPSVKEAKKAIETSEHVILTDTQRDLRSMWMSQLGFPVELRWNRKSSFFIGCHPTKWNAEFTRIERIVTI